MVAIKALSQEGTTPFALAYEGVCHLAETPRSTAAQMNTTG